jgi:hypothetical protein
MKKVLLTILTIQSAVSGNEIQFSHDDKSRNFQNSFYDVELQNLISKFSDGLIDLSQMRVRRVKGTKERGMSGPWINHGPIDNSFKFKVTFFKKQGGEYRLLPYNMPLSEFCSAINNEPYAMPDFARHSNFTLPVPCPLVNVSGVACRMFID